MRGVGNEDGRGGSWGRGARDRGKVLGGRPLSPNFGGTSADGVRRDRGWVGLQWFVFGAYGGRTVVRPRIDRRSLFRSKLPQYWGLGGRVGGRPERFPGLPRQPQIQQHPAP